MADNIPDNAPNDTPADTPIDTPVALQFPGQTYRDRSASPISDDSDSGPIRPNSRRPNTERSQSTPEIDPSAGPIGPFYVDPARLLSNPFPLPLPGPPGVNPFSGLPLPPQPGTSRRGSRPKTAQGSPPPSRPPTRGSAAGGGGGTNIAPAVAPPRKISRPSAPLPPSAKRPIKKEESNSAPAESFTRAIPPRNPSPPLAPPVATISHRRPSGPDAVGQNPARKRVAKSKKRTRRPLPRNRNPGPRRPYVRVADREKIVSGPPTNTRARGGRVEFGFGDLDLLQRRRREERRAGRERKNPV